MANKNTKAKRRAQEKQNKRGVAVNSTNNGKWRGSKIPSHDSVVAEIQKVTKRLYGGI